MFVSITPEELTAELHACYGYTVSLNYAMNYIGMNEYATADDFHLWLQSLNG